MITRATKAKQLVKCHSGNFQRTAEKTLHIDDIELQQQQALILVRGVGYIEDFEIKRR